MEITRVLVIDDEVDFLDYVEKIVTRVGFRCETLSDATLFQNQFHSDIDIIILDLFMPGMDGIELLRLLDGTDTNVSLIFMSGQDTGVLKTAQKLALEMGIDVLGILQKPFHMVDMEKMLYSFVKDQNSDSGNAARGDNFVPNEQDIRQALIEKHFSLVFQPQINLKTREVEGCEALIRWHHPEHGFVPPNLFIPISEKLNLISDITDYVIQHALEQLAMWHQQGHKLLLSLNISGKLLDDLELPEKLSSMVNHLNLEPKYIILEITETALNQEVKTYMDILTRLKMKKFLLSIDDFGTGYSFLQQLIRIPFDELKIDLSFIRNYFNAPEYKTIADITVILAHRLNMQVVAEGIEDERTMDALNELGCEIGQGYHIARPMTVDKFDLWLSKRTVKSE